MAVYEGVLRKISSGEFHGRWSIREFIDVGEHHIRNVALTEYHAQLLADAMGQQVALSVVGSRGMRPGRKAVMVVWTPERGVVKALTLPALIATIFFRTILLTWFSGIILILFVWGFASLFGAGDSNAVAFVLLGLAAFFFFGPLISAVRLARAWAAGLGGQATSGATDGSRRADAAPAVHPSPEPATSTPGRYCGNCGAERRADARFCTNCGHA